jgi:hypothetical protein
MMVNGKPKLKNDHNYSLNEIPWSGNSPIPAKVLNKDLSMGGLLDPVENQS